MANSVQAEQERFSKMITERFISLFNFVHNIAEKEHLTINEACLFILVRLNNYLNNSDYQIACELPEPPYKQYSLLYIRNEQIIEYLEFCSKHGRFRSERIAKKYGLFIEHTKNIMNGLEYQHKEQINNNKNYSLTERTTHLQIIAILATELAKTKSKYKFSNGKINNLGIAKTLEQIAKDIEIETLKSRSAETYRKRLAEAIKYFE